MVPLGIDLRARGPRVASLVRARRAKAQERLPSCQEPASRNPRTAGARTFDRLRSHAHRFAIHRLVPASGVVSSFLPASAPESPRGLSTSRCPRRSMRPTDFCHPIELRAPVPRAFPTRSRDFRRGGTPRSLWLHAVLPGEGEFHASRIRFGGSFQTQPRPRRASRVGLEPFAHLAVRDCSRGWALSSHRAWRIDRTSDIPVASPSSDQAESPSWLFAWALGSAIASWIGKEPPRPP